MHAGSGRAPTSGSCSILTGATVGVFASQDLLLFYVFYEAMLIPLYFLIGSGAGRIAAAATIKFVIYTMVGSLLMLVAVIAFGVVEGTFDLTKTGSNESLAIFLGFAVAFAHQGTALALPRLATRRLSAGRRPRSPRCSPG